MTTFLITCLLVIVLAVLSIVTDDFGYNSPDSEFHREWSKYLNSTKGVDNDYLHHPWY